MTGLTQPLHIAVNILLNGLVREYSEEAQDRMERVENFENWSVGQHRIDTTEAVGQAWESWHSDPAKQRTVIQALRHTCITLPVDGSCDHELKIKGFEPG